jgi:hypothetical protein
LGHSAPPAPGSAARPTSPVWPHLPGPFWPAGALLGRRSNVTPAIAIVSNARPPQSRAWRPSKRKGNECVDVRWPDHAGDWSHNIPLTRQTPAATATTPPGLTVPVPVITSWQSPPLQARGKQMLRWEGIAQGRHGPSDGETFGDSVKMAKSATRNIAALAARSVNTNSQHHFVASHGIPICIPRKHPSLNLSQTRAFTPRPPAVRK